MLEDLESLDHLEWLNRDLSGMINQLTARLSELRSRMRQLSTKQLYDANEIVTEADFLLKATVL